MIVLNEKSLASQRLEKLMEDQSSFEIFELITAIQVQHDTQIMELMQMIMSMGD